MGRHGWLAGSVAAVLFMMCGEASAAGEVTFNKDVLPILERNCQSCHRPGNIAPMSLLNYDTTRPWAKAMKAAVMSRKMPPWFADPQYGHFSNDPSLKQEDILTGQASLFGTPVGDDPTRVESSHVLRNVAPWSESVRTRGFRSS